jgi:hypothetical protein
LVQDAFWELVERVRRLVEDDRPRPPVNQECERYADCLRRELQAFEPAELESFQDWLQVAVAEAWTEADLPKLLPRLARIHGEA